MQEQDVSATQEEQEKALEYLKKAQEELEKEKWEYEKIRQEKIMFNLEQKLKEILEDHKKTMQETKELDQRIQQYGVTRLDLITLRRKLIPAQTSLIEKNQEVLEMLEKEESQVFIWICKQIHEDMQDILENFRQKTQVL